MIVDSLQPEVRMWCDGSSDGRTGGVGGWAYVLEHVPTGARKEASGRDENATNNRMELLSAVMGLRAVKRPTRVVVYSDSQNVVRTATTWMWQWLAYGWSKRDGSPVANLDLVKQLMIEVQRLGGRENVAFEWVRGHDACLGNVRCDELAVLARTQAAVQGT